MRSKGDSIRLENEPIMSSRQSSDGYTPAAAPRTVAVYAFLATALIAGASAAEVSPAGDGSGYPTSTDAKAITDSFGEC